MQIRMVECCDCISKDYAKMKQGNHRNGDWIDVCYIL